MMQVFSASGTVYNSTSALFVVYDGADLGVYEALLDAQALLLGGGTPARRVDEDSSIYKISSIYIWIR